MEEPMKLRPNGRLKLLLFQKGVTQRQLAFGANIDESRISRIIHGYEKPTSEMREAIAEYLNESESELFPRHEKGRDCTAP
jgi:transcriptional regulator with XRE-family HTH domain